MGSRTRWQGFSDLSGDILQRLDQLMPIFEREGVLLAYLFGSLSQTTKGNDVDLALLLKNEPAFHLRDAVVDCLGTERVDVIDLHNASPVLRFEIVRSGRVLYAPDAALQEQFEMATIHLYRDTHFMRDQQDRYLRERFAKWSSSGG